RHEQGIVPLQLSFDGGNPALTGAQYINVIMCLHVATAQKPGDHARVICLFVVCKKGLMPVPGFGCRQPAMTVDVRMLVEFREINDLNMRAGGRQHVQCMLESRLYIGLDMISQCTSRYSQSQAVQ